MLKFLKASKNYPNLRLPAEFEEINSEVSVSFISCKGRGLVSKQEFFPGDIILGHRALAIQFSDPDLQLSSLLSKVKKFRSLKESLANSISIDEELREKVYSLSAGPKLGFIQGNKIIKSGKEESLFKGGLSMARVEGILITNGFQGSISSASDNSTDEGPFGLWYLPSFINHDCFLTNANWIIVNDFMFIISAKRIKPGEEILIR